MCALDPITAEAASIEKFCPQAEMKGQDGGVSQNK